MANLLGNNFADRAVSCPAYTSGIDGANARRAGKLGHSLNLPRIFVSEAGQAQGLQLFAPLSQRCYAVGSRPSLAM